MRKREANSGFGIHETPTRPAFVPEAARRKEPAAQSAIVKKAQPEPPPSDPAAIAAVFEASVRELLERTAPLPPLPPAAQLEFVVVEAPPPELHEPEAETTPMPRTPPPRRKRWELRIALLAVLVAGEVALAYRASVAHGVHTVAALVGAR